MGTLPASVTITNLQSGSTTQSFPVDFYLALSSSFSPSSDDKVGSATVAGIGSNQTVSVSVSLAIPSLGGNANECVYIYADVNAAGSVTEADMSNNVSTVDKAGVVLVAKTPSPQTYDVMVETYSGSGSPPADPNFATGLALYKDNGSNTVTFISKYFAAAVYGALDFSATGLSSGTYYALVVSIGSSTGPYAFNVRTLNIDQARVADVNAESSSNDNTLPITLSQSSIANYTGSPPTNGTPVTVGNAVSWFLASDDMDWFTFRLP